jgi:hypothetical protein
MYSIPMVGANTVLTTLARDRDDDTRQQHEDNSVVAALHSKGPCCGNNKEKGKKGRR